MAHGPGAHDGSAGAELNGAVRRLPHKPALDVVLPCVQVGYMQGAAGMGSMFLWLDAAISGKPSPHIVLPDDYFQSW